MNAVSSLQNVVSYIEAHIHEKMSVGLLAKQASLSPFYFHRLFSRYVGATVMEYIKARRLTIAARAIRNSIESISKIATNVGYENYESFSRDFKKQYSIAPMDYKTSPEKALMLTPVFDVGLLETGLDIGQTYVSNQMTMSIDIIDYTQDVRTVGISKLAGLTKGIDDPGLWDSFSDEIKKGIPNQVDPPVEFGIGLANYEAQGFTYLCARQVMSFDDVPQCYTCYTIPAGSYAVCTFEAESFDLLTNEALYSAGNYMLNTWLPNNRSYRFKRNMTIEVYDSMSFAKDVPQMRYLFPIERQMDFS